MGNDTSAGILKGYKVTDASYKRLVGIACSSLEELKRKGCQRFQIPVDHSTVDVLLKDGTIVDDETYFSTLPNQTLLILRKPGEVVFRDVDILYHALKSLNVELLRTAAEVREFFDDDAQRKITTLSNFLSNQKETQRALLSNRTEDPEWFEDLETLASTKEEYMRKRSSGRIQRYFYDAKEKIKNSQLYAEDSIARKHLDSLMNVFFMQLQGDKFFACLFDRSKTLNGAICDQNGLFVCQGLWNSNECSYKSGDAPTDHRINPYCSREQRIVFTTWNLDHRIERSRAIIPSILKAADICRTNKRYEVNVNYFYDLLFTPKNLKLVHIVCHDKNEHKSAVCNYKKIVIKNNRHSLKNNKRCTSKLKGSVDLTKVKKSKRL